MQRPSGADACPFAISYAYRTFPGFVCTMEWNGCLQHPAAVCSNSTIKYHTLLGYCKPSRRSPATAGVDGQGSQGPIVHNGSKSSVSSPLNKKDASLLYFFFLEKFDRDVDVDGGTFRVSRAKPIPREMEAYLLYLEGSRRKTGLWLGSKDVNVCGPCSRRLLRRPSIDPRHTGPAVQRA